MDLPPVANIDEVWAGTEPMKANPNPAATLCDKAKFTGPKVESARSRVYVIPEETRLPKEFGLSETIGRFEQAKAARSFSHKVEKKIERCEKNNLSATIRSSSDVSTKSATGEKISGRTWRIGFEVNKKTKVFYRVALIRRGRDVAQVSFSPSKGFDIEAKAFDRLAARSGERLAYLR